MLIPPPVLLPEFVAPSPINTKLMPVGPADVLFTVLLPEAVVPFPMMATFIPVRPLPSTTLVAGFGVSIARGYEVGAGAATGGKQIIDGYMSSGDMGHFDVGGFIETLAEWPRPL